MTPPPERDATFFGRAPMFARAPILGRTHIEISCGEKRGRVGGFLRDLVDPARDPQGPATKGRTPETGRVCGWIFDPYDRCDRRTREPRKKYIIAAYTMNFNISIIPPDREYSESSAVKELRSILRKDDVRQINRYLGEFDLNPHASIRLGESLPETPIIDLALSHCASKILCDWVNRKALDLSMLIREDRIRLACMTGHLDMLQTEIRKSSIHLARRRHLCRCPLEYARRCGHLKIVHWLITKGGADPCCTCDGLGTHIERAAENDHLAMLKSMVLCSGVALDYPKESYYGNTSPRCGKWLLRQPGYAIGMHGRLAESMINPLLDVDGCLNLNHADVGMTAVCIIGKAILEGLSITKVDLSENPQVDPLQAVKTLSAFCDCRSAPGAYITVVLSDVSVAFMNAVKYDKSSFHRCIPIFNFPSLQSLVLDAIATQLIGSAHAGHVTSSDLS